MPASKVKSIEIDGVEVEVGYTMAGATASENGAEGYVPAPAAGDQNKFLKGDKTWAAVATLDSGGKVPSSMLPSYVDDVVEYSSYSQFPLTGETGKIYVDTATNMTYRWSGSEYISISNPVDVMTGATASAAGTSGLVPAPTAGDQDKFLSGNGTWKNGNVTVELSRTIAPSSWSSTSPYSYTVTDSRITSGSIVEVEILKTSVDKNVLYIDSVASVGSVTLTPNVKPTENIAVVISITNARAASGENIYADDISTDAVSGAANVQEALEKHEEDIAALEEVDSNMAIIVNGDTCAHAVPVGGYAYIKNNTHGLADGLYRNKSNSAFPTSGGTADNTVFEEVSNGGLNALNDKLTQLVTITKDNLSATAGTALNLGSISDMIPSGSTLVGIVKIRSAGTNSGDYGMIQANATATSVIFMPTVTQTGLSVKFSILYK